ncbi:hypothetical protein ACOMHN_061439 [Nucella lapillus]
MRGYRRKETEDEGTGRRRNKEGWKTEGKKLKMKEQGEEGTRKDEGETEGKKLKMKEQGEEGTRKDEGEQKERN